MEISNPKHTVIVGVGVPGCGKTTYLKPFAAMHGMAYVNADDIREKVTGDAADHSKETLVWQLVHEAVIAGIPGGGNVSELVQELMFFRNITSVTQITRAWKI